MRQMVENKQSCRFGWPTIPTNCNYFNLIMLDLLGLTCMVGFGDIFFSLCTVLATHHLMDAYRLDIASTSPFHILHNLISKQTFNSIPFFFSCILFLFVHAFLRHTNRDVRTVWPHGYGIRPTFCS